MAEGAECAAHLDDGLRGTAGVDAFHRVEGFGPGADRGVKGALFDLDGAEVSEGDGVGAAEGLCAAGADAAGELPSGAVQITECGQGVGGLRGEGRLAEEEDPLRFGTGGGVGGGEVVLGPPQRGDGCTPLTVSGEGTGVDDPDEGPFTGTCRGVALALDGGGGEVHGIAAVAEIGGLVGHGTQDVSGEGRVVGFGGHTQCESEVVLGPTVLGAVEAHPAHEVGEFTGS